MEEKEFSTESLHQLKKLLDLARTHQNPPRGRTELRRLSSLVDQYLDDQVLSHPELLDELPVLARHLRDVPKVDAQNICEHILTTCRICMFHNDGCFLNLIYLIFRSVELGELVEPNRVRPSMRIHVAYQTD